MINQKAGVKVRTMSDGQVFQGPGHKGEDVYQREIKMIVSAVDKLTQQQELKVFQSLGITPIWYDDHGDIPEIIKDVYNAP